MELRTNFRHTILQFSNFPYKITITYTQKSKIFLPHTRMVNLYVFTFCTQRVVNKLKVQVTYDT